MGLSWSDIDADTVSTPEATGDEDWCAGNTHQKPKSKINKQDIYPEKPFVASVGPDGRHVPQ